MATVLLAIGDGPLRRWCAQALTGAGHATVEVTRAMGLLDLGSRWRGDASDPGRNALRVGHADYAACLIGLGVTSQDLRTSNPRNGVADRRKSRSPSIVSDLLRKESHVMPPRSRAGRILSVSR